MVTSRSTGGLLILLLNDLRTFLRWISVNPLTEKPPTPFLPGEG